MEKKTFKEKWQDKKYQAKVKLSSYGIFIFIIILILLLGNTKEYENPSIYDDNTISNDKQEYIYQYEITIDEDTTYYYLDDSSIIKQKDNMKYTYKIIDDKYYIEDNGNYLLTSISDIYDNIDYKYLSINYINTYLTQEIVYLKDIIDTDSNDYILINRTNNTIKIDYTSLMNILLNKDYEKYIITIYTR